MHSRYNPEDYNLWLQYYAAQAAQTGFGIDGFHGIPYQRGAGLGSFFHSLFRMAIPVVKNVGKQVGRHALLAGANIASDLAKGRPLMESTTEHARDQVQNLLRESLQTGKGLGRRPKSINNHSDHIPDVFMKSKNVSTRRKIYSKHKK